MLTPLIRQMNKWLRDKEIQPDDHVFLHVRTVSDERIDSMPLMYITKELWTKVSRQVTIVQREIMRTLRANEIR